VGKKKKKEKRKKGRNLRINAKPTPFVNLNNPMELIVITFWAGK